MHDGVVNEGCYKKSANIYLIQNLTPTVVNQQENRDLVIVA